MEKVIKPEMPATVPHLEEHFNVLRDGEQVFIFHYRPKFKPTQDYVKGKDLATVKKQCIEYCSRFDLNFISVRPFFLDLSKKPRDSTGFQQSAEV